GRARVRGGAGRVESGGVAPRFPVGRRKQFGVFRLEKGCAARPGDVVRVACNALYVSSKDRVGSVDAGSSVSPAARGTDDVILKPVDNEEVNELLTRSRQ